MYPEPNPENYRASNHEALIRPGTETLIAVTQSMDSMLESDRAVRGTASKLQFALAEHYISLGAETSEGETPYNGFERTILARVSLEEENPNHSPRYLKIQVNEQHEAEVCLNGYDEEAKSAGSAIKDIGLGYAMLALARYDEDVNYMKSRGGKSASELDQGKRALSQMMRSRPDKLLAFNADQIDELYRTASYLYNDDIFRDLFDAIEVNQNAAVYTSETAQYSTRSGIKVNMVRRERTDRDMVHAKYIELEYPQDGEEAVKMLDLTFEDEGKISIMAYPVAPPLTANWIERLSYSYARQYNPRLLSEGRTKPASQDDVEEFLQVLREPPAKS
jgi:hypothetical protein